MHMKKPSVTILSTSLRHERNFTTHRGSLQQVQKYMLYRYCVWFAVWRPKSVTTAPADHVHCVSHSPASTPIQRGLILSSTNSCVRWKKERSVRLTVYICHCCSKQIKRNISNENFTPRWKSRHPTTNKCGIGGCTSEAKKNTQLASTEEIEMIMGQSVTSFTVAADRTIVPLCQVHYNEVYHLLQPITCDACGIKPRKEEHFNRHCPNLVAINAYLSVVATDPTPLTDKSRICRACYNHFKYIEMFTAVSVDNIDILQPYSFVSATDLLAWYFSSVCTASPSLWPFNRRRHAQSRSCDCQQQWQTCPQFTYRYTYSCREK